MVCVLIMVPIFDNEQGCLITTVFIISNEAVGEVCMVFHVQPTQAFI